MLLLKKSHEHTEDNDPDVEVFLSGLVLGCDGVTSRVTPQTDRYRHNRSGVCGLHLNKQNTKIFKELSYVHKHNNAMVS